MILTLVLGLAMLVAGGELLVRGAVSLAIRLGVSPLMIGLTLVGFGTSTPELVTAVDAALAGAPGLAVGNVVGSNIANIFLILGTAAAIAPIAWDAHAIVRDSAALVVSTLALVAAALLADIGVVHGLALILLLLGYLRTVYVLEKRHAGPVETMFEGPTEAARAGLRGWRQSLISAFGGLALVVFGAPLVVSGAVDLARWLGVSDIVIGLTVIAIGTSLPELVASAVAARRGQGGIALGNIIGSNVFNAFGILGVTAVVQPFRVAPEILRFDIWVLVAATGFLAIGAVTAGRLSRLEGLVMVAAYGAYLAALVVLTRMGAI